MSADSNFEVPPTRFAPARGGRIAYQIYGEGPPTVVAVPPLAQNIEVAWEWREAARAHEAWVAALDEIGITVEPFEASSVGAAS